MHFVEQQKSPKFNTVSYSARPKNVRKATEVDMLDGVVDLDAFNQIVALDDGDVTKEFSKTLVTAWCEQAEDALEEMQRYIDAKNLTDAAHKAHYLKGSSASLELIQVSKTCQAIYRLRFPASLEAYRTLAYSSESTTPTSNGTRSSSSSSDSTAAPSLTFSPSLSHSPENSEDVGYFDFGSLDKAKGLLETLRGQIKVGSDWLTKYYHESDRIASLGLRRSSTTGG